MNYTFKMNFAYDSWKIYENRVKRKQYFFSKVQPNLREANFCIQSMTYPDGEKVIYGYNLGGMLSSIGCLNALCKSINIYADFNKEENECYWYHPDHLGSSSWITYTDGSAIQHLHYLPWGEDMVNQQLSGFGSMYTFSAKEKDTETGYSYFGARYYDSELSIWLSVDPMADKYPSLSPYTYCADNPVKLVDPNGEEVIITGEGAAEAFKQLQASTSLKLSRDEKTGVVTASGKCKYDTDKLLLSAIEDKRITVHVNAINGNENDNVFGGSFMGNEISKQGEITLPKPFAIIGGFDHVDTRQNVDPYECVGIDKYGTYYNIVDGSFPATYGSAMLHEITESYLGGIKALELNTPLLPAISGNSTYKYYEQAHNAAAPQHNQLLQKKMCRK